MAESLHILLGTSACLQWLCHSGERTVARGPLVYFSEKIRLDISCEFSAQTIHMKYQVFFFFRKIFFFFFIFFYFFFTVLLSAVRVKVCKVSNLYVFEKKKNVF